MKRKICAHGNDTVRYLCPDCDAARMTQRQRRADRARFKARLAKIAGTGRSAGGRAAGGSP